MSDEQFVIEERAAILEYDANLPRHIAERLAREQCRKLMYPELAFPN
jgi:hypothetical protein